jgi:glyoxylase-like metal-dependent hydrolase (beta-lactamase superfamily II)
MSQHAVGHIVIQGIVESVCADFHPSMFFPETTPEDWARHRKWMEQEPRAIDPASGNLILTIQAFLLRTRHHTILIDTCVGNDKPRLRRPFWHMQRLDTFLPRLAAAGVAPESVDYVMCTHLHWDHVGWNTQLRDGRWVPTFPNARYIFARREWESWEALHRQTPQPQIVDSILPVIEARQAQFVGDDFALDDEVWLEPTPGHTAGHVSIRLSSGDANAVITGDCIHSPVQCLEPGWIMQADSDPALARTTRRNFLERYCDSSALVCATHFPEPSIGRVVRHENAFRFSYGAGSSS